MAAYSKLSLTALFITSSIIWISGNGILPLLPVYAGSLGASNFEIGLYLAFSYACLAIGAVITAKSIHSQHAAKQIMVISGALAVPITFCVGQAHSLFELMAFTSLIWMLGGAGFSALNSLVSGFTAAQHRGKIMGALAITSPLGSVIGGGISGPIVDIWGFDALFLTLALINLLWPVCAMFVKTSQPTVLDFDITSSSQKTTLLRWSKHALHLNHLSWKKRLILATSFSYMAYYVALLATSITMKDAGFSATDISSTAIVGGLAAIPFIYSISHASDALGRKALWVFCNLVGAVALLLLSMAETLLTFWAVAFMIRCLSSGSRSIGSAWVADLYDHTAQPNNLSTAQSDTANPDIANPDITKATSNQKRTGLLGTEEKALALISATPWLGGILGYLMYGSASLVFSSSHVLMVAAVVPLLSIGLVFPIGFSPLASANPLTKAS
ncbi:MFS transporter [Litoribrevibacter euphylliae]|uniref:MFS transporter n=1 Tax=Litoribrevibacter euphylliae TaxID=1834034 RepID=A0ABV7H8X3_9GAMM